MRACVRNADRRTSRRKQVLKRLSRKRDELSLY